MKFELRHYCGVAVVAVTQFLESFAFSLQNADSDSTSTVTETTNGDNYEKYYVEYSDSYDSDQSAPNTWSVVWYIASFTGLILFFLIVSCSEWCCRRNARRNCQRTAIPQTGANPRVNDTPPPPYDNFAPPKYEEVLMGMCSSSGEKSKFDVFVVSEHTLGTIMKEAGREDAPPSYHSASTQFARTSELPRVHAPIGGGASRVT